ncbi:MAG: hypothetical protein HY834_18290 [Devosia nanyangense]|uniref:DUF4403 family protein n=1 Tax=Devosia nanyangense TaxID=1228055 RepID=A0A933P0E5_9HYPH|nr:hypothetical protein [Devosia nanyangense]
MLKTSKAALFAAMLSVSAAPVIGILPVAAQETQPPSFSFSITVPTIVPLGSSMDEATLKDVFTSSFLSHADDLASLDATSITIPELTLNFTVTDSGQTVSTRVTYTDVVLTNVKDGIAESLTIRTAENVSSEGTTTYGESAQQGFDLRRTFEFIGIVRGDAAAAMKPVATSYASAGSKYASPMFNCDIGPTAYGLIEARPAKVSFATVLDAIAGLGDLSREPPPESISNLVRYFADLLTGFRGGAATVGAVDCTVPASVADGTEVSIKLGGMNTGDFEQGVYPSVALNGLSIDAGTMGHGTLENFTLKPTDLNPPIQAIEAETGTLTPQWFEANARRLIPSFGGFSFAGLDLDTVNPDKPGERVKARIGSFDLSLADYFNGIPTVISTSASGIDVPLPQDTTDPQIATLLAAGLTNVNMGFDLAAAWDKDTQTINVDKVGIAGVDLGGMSLSATIGNATEQLFDVNPDIATAASFGVTVKDVTINVTDDGLGAIVWPIAAAQQGISDIEAYRTQMAGFAEGLAIQLLGSTEAARQLGTAVGDFATGRKGELTIQITSKDPKGIALPVFMAAQDNPTVLAGLVEVTGIAK